MSHLRQILGKKNSAGERGVIGLFFWLFIAICIIVFLKEILKILFCFYFQCLYFEAFVYFL